ncbi:MAG: choice-of-anchor tandem repeat GloVer-containing protein [Candidatus Korobacteraceae bacterium]
MLYLTPRKRFCCANLCLAMLAASLVSASPAQAQTLTVIHSFSGPDGANPVAGLSIDAKGRLYGTTQSGGHQSDSCMQGGCGTVFRLTNQGGGWILNSLHDFNGPNDGSTPMARPVFAPNGLLYGTTDAGGAQFCEGPGCGTAYSLRPGATACTTALCAWQESIVYSFGGIEAICGGFGDWSASQIHQPQAPGDVVIGSCPSFGDLTFDSQGNIYGTVPCCHGAVYELSPAGTPTALYYFTGGADGDDPLSGVIFDQAGNLYGTTNGGGAHGCGTVYELSPNGGRWTETVLYSFQCGTDGQNPIGGLIMDSASNLYGTTNFGGANSGGTVFELSPSGGGSWTFQLLYSLAYDGTFDFVIYGPTGTLTMDASGSLYGTTFMDGAYSAGSVFKLTPQNGSWSYTSLHDFTAGFDGSNPFGNVVMDANGNVYGTAGQGGGNECNGLSCGDVWEITP